MYDSYYTKAQQVRQLVINDFNSSFNNQGGFRKKCFSLSARVSISQIRIEKRGKLCGYTVVVVKSGSTHLNEKGGMRRRRRRRRRRGAALENDEEKVHQVGR